MAEGVSGIIFKNESHIHLHEKIQTVLVQTDKALYKPGDKVNFRILVLDLNLKPAVIRGDMQVFITVSEIISENCEKVNDVDHLMQS